jgi:hypothetical protein
MLLDLRSLREWLLVALHRGRVTALDVVGPDSLAAGLVEPVPTGGAGVHPEG